MKDSRDDKTPLMEGTGRVDEMLERALVDKVCLWSYRVTFYLVVIAALMLYVSGQDNWVNPAAVGVFSFLSGQYLDGPQHITLTLIFLGFAIVQHSMQQGCTASLVPALFSMYPCVFGFLYRTRRAVIYTGVICILVVFGILMVDLTDNCPSEPIASDDKGTIVADRFIVLFNAIMGNCFVLVGIVGQSQRSIELQAQATQTADRMAKIRQDVLHRVTHELRTYVFILPTAETSLCELQSFVF